MTNEKQTSREFANEILTNQLKQSNFKFVDSILLKDNEKIIADILDDITTNQSLEKTKFLLDSVKQICEKLEDVELKKKELKEFMLKIKFYYLTFIQNNFINAKLLKAITVENIKKIIQLTKRRFEHFFDFIQQNTLQQQTYYKLNTTRP